LLISKSFAPPPQQKNFSWEAGVFSFDLKHPRLPGKNEMKNRVQPVAGPLEARAKSARKQRQPLKEARHDSPARCPRASGSAGRAGLAGLAEGAAVPRGEVRQLEFAAEAKRLKVRIVRRPDLWKEWNGTMARITVRMLDEKHRWLQRLAAGLGVSLNRLLNDFSTVALAQYDAEMRFRKLARAGKPAEGLRLLDHLDEAFWRKSTAARR